MQLPLELLQLAVLWATAFDLILQSVDIITCLLKCNL